MNPLHQNLEWSLLRLKSAVEWKRQRDWQAQQALEPQEIELLRQIRDMAAEMLKEKVA